MKIIDQIRSLVADLNPAQFKLSRDAVAELLAEFAELEADTAVASLFATNWLSEAKKEHARANSAEKLVSDMRSADRNWVEQTDKIISRLEAEKACLLGDLRKVMLNYRPAEPMPSKITVPDGYSGEVVAVTGKGVKVGDVVIAKIEKNAK